MKLEKIFTSEELAKLRAFKQKWKTNKQYSMEILQEDFSETVKRRLEYQKWRIQTGKIQS